MFSSEEWAALVGKLRQLTQAGKISWTAKGDSALSVDLGSAQYRLSSRDEDDQPPWVLTVTKRSTDWTEPDRYVDSLTGIYQEEVSSIPASLVPGLRDIAYRMSLGGPQLASDLLSEMLEVDPTEPPKYYGDTPF